jgi:hypothetical protein
VQAVGSLLIGTSAEEAQELQQRAAALQASGLDATFLDAAALALAEPALNVPEGGSGLLVASDAQLVSAAGWLRPGVCHVVHVGVQGAVDTVAVCRAMLLATGMEQQGSIAWLPALHACACFHGAWTGLLGYPVFLKPGMLLRHSVRRQLGVGVELLPSPWCAAERAQHCLGDAGGLQAARQ